MASNCQHGLLSQHPVKRDKFTGAGADVISRCTSNSSNEVMLWLVQSYADRFGRQCVSELEYLVRLPTQHTAATGGKNAHAQFWHDGHCA